MAGDAEGAINRQEYQAIVGALTLARGQGF